MTGTTLTDAARASDHRLASEALVTMADGAPEAHAEAMTRTAARLVPDLDHARRSLRVDEFVDAPSTTVHLNDVVVAALLEARGWARDSRLEWRNTWVSPDGANYGYEEALAVALTAEGLS